MIDYRDLALRANQSLKDGKPLVLESEAEKVAIRSYAEFEVAWQQGRLGLVESS